MALTPSSPRPQQSRLAGIGLRLGATSCFGVMAAAIKLGYEAGVSTPELVFYRFAFGLPPLLIWIAASGNFGAWRTRRPLAHLGRGAIGLAIMVLAFSALGYLPLAEATTIGFAAPLFAVMLSALLLGEEVGRHRWGAVALGLAGVAVVMQPGGAALPLQGLVIAIVSALGVACVTITIRQIGRTESTQTIVLWFTGLSTLTVGAAMPFFGQPHDAATWGILLALGLFGGVAQLMLTASLRYAPVSVIAPFDYIQLVWAVLLGWLIWERQPLASTWLGAALIVASGLYTLFREHKLGRDKPRAAPL